MVSLPMGYISQDGPLRVLKHIAHSLPLPSGKISQCPTVWNSSDVFEFEIRGLLGLPV